MTHKNLEVWTKSISFVTIIYKETSHFPDSEKFGLLSQMRRSAVSIPSNIAEGAGRQSNKEFAQFLYISLGSAAELQTQLLIAKNLNFMSDEQFNHLDENLTQISKMLSGLIKSVKLKIARNTKN